MQFIHYITTSFFLLALTHAAPASGAIAALDLACEMSLDQCPTAILEALESICQRARQGLVCRMIEYPIYRQEFCEGCRERMWRGLGEGNTEI